MKADGEKWAKLGKFLASKNGKEMLANGKITSQCEFIRSATNCSFVEAYNIMRMLLQINNRE